jgi:hypothetical protein
MIELLLQAERALSVGLLDRAETLYRQVATADPRNSIAVVGLARVTLDRGDEVGALALARRALTIDPENAAAQRMVARLEEVLDYRADAAAAIVPEASGAAGADAETTATAAIGEPEATAEPAAGAVATVEASTGTPVEPPVASAPEPSITADPAHEPASEPSATAVPAAPEPAASAEPVEPRPPPEPAPRRRRTFLDWLFRRR